MSVDSSGYLCVQNELVSKPEVMMRIKGIFVVAILTAVLCVSGTVLAGTYSGGNGSSWNPYQISTVEDWQDLMATPGDWYWFFILTADIDLTGETLTPVGNGSTPFTGVFDGNDNIISNAVINQPGNDYIGLIGYVGWGGQIRNLGVENVNMTGRNAVGGLVGMTDHGTLIGCYAAGSVSGDIYVGGLAGYNIIGSLTSCFATGSAIGTSYIGGLVGINNSGTLTGCYATGAVTGTANIIGGLVGENTGSTATVNCYATGAVSGEGVYVGGLVGGNGPGAITECYSTGLVSGTNFVGGIAGWNGSGAITACFWDTETSETSDGVGNVNPDPAGAMGKTTVQMKTLSTFTSAGWDFVNTWWMPDSSYPHLFWAKYSGGSGTAEDPYQIANVADFQLLSASPTDWNKSFILTADIDLTGLTFTQAPIAPDTDSVTSGFQGTQFTGVFDGKGHSISNLTITASTKDYLGLFGYVGSGGQIRIFVVENANISGRYRVGGLVGYNSSGSITFCCATGSVTGTYRVGGLVGYNSSGSITSCYATCSVSVGSYRDSLPESFGGLVGENGGSLTSCYATGAVSGDTTSGGLAGYNGGSISNCYATGDVNGNGGGSSSQSAFVGGLVGMNGGTLTDCYATGTVIGNTSVGGLVGMNGGTLTDCYAIGTVIGNTSVVGGLVGHNGNGSGPLTACFWDTETCFPATVGVGSGISTGVTGKTTAEMMALATFTDAGWDFTNESTNGTNDYWMMLREGEDYPRLAWQPVYPGDIAGLYGVDSVDYAEIAAHWGQTGCPTGCEDADINGDGTVDIFDLMLLADNWLDGNFPGPI
jgi:hypothetical protein